MTEIQSELFEKWFPNQDSKWHEQNISDRTESALTQISLIRSSLVDCSKYSPQGGKPKDMNLQNLINPLLEILIAELIEASKRGVKLRRDRLKMLTPFKEDLITSVDDLGVLSIYVVTMISNFLEATGTRTSLAGVTIWKSIEGSHKRRLKKIPLL